jgi:hypothetical protein
VVFITTAEEGFATRNSAPGMVRRAVDSIATALGTYDQMYLMALSRKDGYEGGVLIDTPGMRELQLWEGGETLGDAFADVDALAAGCRFRDCRHGKEPGCAVRAAVAAGELSADRFESFRKLADERAHQARQLDARAMLEEKRRSKVQTRALNKHLKDKS